MNNAQVAHKFAYGKEGNGSNFYSYGDTLYSYDSLLARDFGNIILINENIANYSNSSQKHKFHLLRSIEHKKYMFVSKLDKYGKFEKFINDEEFVNKLNKLIDVMTKQSRARKTDYTHQINSIREDLDTIIELGDISNDNILAYYDLNENIHKIIEENKIRAKEQKQKEIYSRFAKNVEKYEKFTNRKCTYSANELDGYYYLKIVDDVLVTSGSVTVDVSRAKYLYKMYKNGEYIIGLSIGQYKILESNDKYVKIGCHKILAKELDRVLGE